MKEKARQARAENRIIGLVPTMGALHDGHASLIARAKRECSPVIASIFVNPKQFGPSEDFAKYPRSFETDCEKLRQAGVDALLAPEAAEVYPKGFSTYVHVEGLSEKLEGRSRPGHFRGVSTVVLKLLAAVDYAAVVDAESFEPVVRVSCACYVLLAVFIGKTRLIDNLYVEPKAPGSDELVFHL